MNERQKFLDEISVAPGADDHEKLPSRVGGKLLFKNGLQEKIK